MLVGEAGADLLQILDVLFALVIAVCPIKSVEMPVLKVEGGFHENSTLHIDALALVLGCCQEKLPESHVARIEIYRSKSRCPVFLGYFKLDGIGPKFDIDNRFAFDKLLVAKECTDGRIADFFFVIIGKGEGERFQVQVFFSKTLFEHASHCIYRIGVLCENAYDNFNLGWSSYFTHGRKFSNFYKMQFLYFLNMSKFNSCFKTPLFTFVLSSLVCTLSSAYAEAPRVVPEILDSVPHETSHFTQGLSFDGKEMIETTGLYGKSGLYRRTLEGKILDSARLEERYFGEGSVVLGDEIYYLTWKSHKAFIYGRKPFKYKGEFRIPTEGWGLTLWQDQLLMSNGTDELLQIAPGGFAVSGNIKVRDGRYSIKLLNELEVVGNTLYANIWQTDLIAEIELPSGKVLRYIDFSKKAGEIRERFSGIDVLNGIAYDGKDFWITGKLWPQIYKVKF